MDEERKKFYASITRSTLSQNELYLIAFNSIIENYGKPKMLFLVKKYDILKNFNKNDLQPKAYWEVIEGELGLGVEPSSWAKRKLTVTEEEN